MKQFKLLFAAGALLFVSSMQAQTDVTSTYLTNPSFELSAAETPSTAQALTNGGSYYGWTLPSLGTNYVNISIGDASNCNGQAFGIPSAKEGSYYYYCRRGWNSSSSADATLSTALLSLPEGHYKLTMDYKGLDSWDDQHNVKGSYLKLEAVSGSTALVSNQTSTFEAVKGNSAGANKFTGDANWKEATLEFDVTTAGDVTLNIVHHLVGGVRTDVVIDNLQLTYTDPLTVLRAQLQELQATATSLLEDANYENVQGELRETLEELAEATVDTETEEAYQQLIDDINDAMDAFTNAKDLYDNIARLNGSSYLNPSEDLLVNGSFDELNQGWTLSNMDYQKNGERPTRYVEKWNGSALTGSGYARQTVSNLPAGAYILKGTVHTNKPENGGTQLKVNDEDISVSGTWTEYEIIYNLEANGNVTVSFDYSNLASNWIAIDGFSLVYGGPYDKYMDDKETYGHKLAWQNALAAAQDAIEDETYQNVTGQERTTLTGLISNNQTEPTTAQGYDDAAADLVAATTAFTNAAPAYDAYVAVQTLALAAYGTLDYASSDAEMELGDPINLTPPSASEAQNMTTYLSQKLRAYYESHAMGDSENATAMTYLINNEKAEDGNNSWSWTGSKNNPASKEPWTDSNNNSSHFYFDGGNWNGTTWTTTMSQTVNLPAGKYLLTAKVRGSENLSTYTMEIGGESVNLPHTGNQGNVFGNGWTDASVEFVSQYGGDATILVTAAAENSGQQWFSISDFRLVQLEEYTVQMATTEDYGYLQEMIDEAEALHWGFQVDEYAPYNYVELLQKLEEAKAVNPEEEHSYDYVNGLTVALSDFICDNDNPMVTNTTEVNAVYDGTFDIHPEQHTTENVVLPGWTTKSGSTRQILKDVVEFPALSDAEDGAALFVHPGIYTYGEQTGYTMPLNANQLYSVEAKYCAWQHGSNNDFTLTITDSEGTTVATKTFAKNETGLNEENALKTAKLFFEAEEDGNYILVVGANGNTAFTDVKIFSYTLEKANLTLASSGYTSWVTTFDVDFNGLDVEAYIVEPDDIDLDNMKIDMTQIYNAAKGTPVIFKGEPSAQFTLTETVESVADWTETNKLKSGADCGGKIDGDNYGFVWMFSKGKFKRCQNGINLNDTKAYLVLDDAILPEGDINFRAVFGDGEANAINGIVDAESAPKAIYNLQGQKVTTPVKGGIYIINGKKTLVK